MSAIETTAVVSGPSGFTRRLLMRPVAATCIAFLAVAIVVAIVAPIVLPAIGSQHAGNLLEVGQGPSWRHVLGTDTLGRDVLDRLLVGTRVTMLGVAEAVIVVLIVGLPLGLAAGYLGGRVDRVVSWLADMMFATPQIVIIIVVLSVFPQSMLAGMITLGVLQAPGMMRIVRSAALPIKEELYVDAARISGLSPFYIISRHILPRISGAVIVQAALISAQALLVQTGLAFLNLLVASPAPSWGGMVADGVSVILLQPWLIWPPGIVIALTVMALGLLGDAVRDASTEQWSGSRRPQRQMQTIRPAGWKTGSGGTSHRRSILSVEGLSVSFASHTGRTLVVEDVGFDVEPGEIVGIVGESGSGKSVTANAILGLLPGTGRVEAGRIQYGGADLATMSERQLRQVRGREIALISQEPMTSLNPAFTVGSQLREAVRRQLGLPRAEARVRVRELLISVELPDPDAVVRRYPHELSGGMAQRVAIARALAGDPKLLIADEPTTALDVTVQADILSLIVALTDSRGMSVILITHDWGVVADVCNRAVVMYAGEVVERASTVDMFRSPLHPYTRGLLAANPHHVSSVTRLPVIPGDVPRPGAWPHGCHFHSRCPLATAECAHASIALDIVPGDRAVRCIHVERAVA